MVSDTAHSRLTDLYAKCYPVGGKPGGLLAEEAAEFRRLAAALGVEVTWRRFDLRTLDWVEHPENRQEEL